LVKCFVTENDLSLLTHTRVLDLAAEVGELAKEVLKGSSYGQEPFSPTENWADELGDVFFSLIFVANSTGVDLEAALAQTLEKYRQRLGRSGEMSSGR
jgi:NTP pyrophosphatase (non-canonical NTP hydrolase)